MLGHGSQGEVAEDDVGGDVLVGGELAAEGAQFLEEGVVGVGERGGVGGVCGELAGGTAGGTP